MMMNKSKAEVLRYWPMATIVKKLGDSGTTRCYIAQDKNGNLLGIGVTIGEAWADAEKQLIYTSKKYWEEWLGKKNSEKGNADKKNSRTKNFQRGN